MSDTLYQSLPCSAVECNALSTTKNISDYPSVAVLLCTYNGERFLKEQLDSIICQKDVNLQLWVSDDGSRDNTCNLLQQYREKRCKDCCFIQYNAYKNFSVNFLSLITQPEIKASYYAFSDQDDVWELNKLARAVQKLKRIAKDVPALYCSRTRLWDESGNQIGFSPLFKRPPSFKNALLQNIGAGNTMVMNKAARDLLIVAGSSRLVSHHDWWTYLLVTGAGGAVIYDHYPSVRYRQHGSNLMGSNCGWIARLQRLKMLLGGSLKQWNTMNLGALQEVKHLLTEENQKLLDSFCKMRGESFLYRLYHLKKSSFYRQTFIDNVAFFLAVVLNKI